MVDMDLSSQNSEIKFLADACGVKNGDPVIFYTDNNGVQIHIESDVESVLPFTLYDVAGRLIRTEELRLQKGYNEISYAPQVAAGVYLACILKKDGTFISKKIIVSGQ
jgi:hypothetical protein